MRSKGGGRMIERLEDIIIDEISPEKEGQLTYMSGLGNHMIVTKINEIIDMLNHLEPAIKKESQCEEITYFDAEGNIVK
jgi:hypothetical protein